VVMRLLTLAASTRAVRTTFKGSMIPALTMSVKAPAAVGGLGGGEEDKRQVLQRVFLYS
jgi:hypothetical protein